MAGRTGHAAGAETAGVRDRIVEAALAVMRESGVRSLTQVQVARRAGVRQSHLTYYFPTRDALLEAVTQAGVDGIAGALGELVAQEEGGGERELLERLAAAVSDLEHMRMFVAMAVAADGDASVRAVMRRATHRMEAVLAGALGGPAAKARARVVLATVWGLGLYRFVMRPRRSADPSADAVELLERGTG